MKVKELEKEFIGIGEVSGMKFAQITSQQHGFIYEVSLEGITPHYEVFERKLSPICIDFEKKIFSETESKVMYPNSKHFGIWAWTCNTLEEAKVKLEKIIEDVERREKERKEIAKNLEDENTKE